MKKFSFGLMALALFAAPAFADEPAATGGAEPAPVVCDLPVVAVHDCKGHDPEVCADANVVMTMTAIPEGGEGAENVDPTLMYMTGIPTDVPMMTQRGEGENFRNLSDVHTMNAASVTATSRFEGLRQVAAERNAFGVERAGVSDRSSLKGMLFGSKADAKARTTLVANDRARLSKMAEVDQLRDKALKSGDVKLLAKADAMEKELKGEAKAKSRFSLFGRK